MGILTCRQSARSKNNVHSLCERTGLRLEELASRIRIIDPDTLRSIADGKESCSFEMKEEIVQGLGLFPTPEHVEMVFPSRRR